LASFAVGETLVLVQNSSGANWRWTPSRQQPLPPRAGGTAPAGDIPELLQHLQQVRGKGATVAEAEQAWVDGMNLINLRAALFPGNGPVVNEFLGTAHGGWRVYRGRPPRPGGLAFLIAFNENTGMIVTGTGTGLVPHPTFAGVHVLQLQGQMVVFA